MKVSLNVWKRIQKSRESFVILLVFFPVLLVAEKLQFSKKAQKNSVATHCPDTPFTPPPLVLKSSTMLETLIERKNGLYLGASVTPTGVGTPGTDSGILKLDCKGVLDQSRGEQGVLVKDISQNKLFDSIRSLAVAPDGGVFAATEYVRTDEKRGVRIVKLKSDGTLDTAFGKQGGVSFSAAAQSLAGTSIPLILRDDNALLVGFNISGKDEVKYRVYALSLQGELLTYFAQKEYFEGKGRIGDEFLTVRSSQSAKNQEALFIPSAEYGKLLLTPIVLNDNAGSYSVGVYSKTS